MAGVNVRDFPVGGSGTGNCWWLWCGGFCVEVRECDGVVLELIVLVSGFIPLRMGVLSKIGNVLVSDVAVGKEIGNVLVLWSVGGVELVGVEFEPVKKLVRW